MKLQVSREHLRRATMLAGLSRTRVGHATSNGKLKAASSDAKYRHLLQVEVACTAFQPRRWSQHDSTMTDSLVGASRVGGGIKVMAIR